MSTIGFYVPLKFLRCHQDILWKNNGLMDQNGKKSTNTPHKHRLRKIEEVCGELRSIAQKTGVKINGPVPLPTKRLRVPVLKAPSGEGTATWDRWEMRIHKRLIDIDSEERVMRRIMRIRVPEEVHVTIELI